MAQGGQSTTGYLPTAGGKGGSTAVSNGALPAGPVYQPGVYGQGKALPPTPGTAPLGMGSYGQYNGNVFGNSSQALQAAQRAAHGMAFGGMNFGGGAAGPDVQTTGWGYDPAQAQGVTGPNPYAASQLADADLSQYMNPYTDQVINRTIGDLDQARLQAVNSTGYDATRQGAFGGSRHALREARNDADFYEQAARTAGDLRFSGYQNAQNAALADVGSQNQASQFNLGQDMQTRLANLQNNQYNAASQNQASQFGQQSALQAQMANQQASAAAAQAAMNARVQARGQNLQAAQLLGNLGNLGFGMGQQVKQGNAAQGALERALSQGLIDSAKGQFAGYTGAPAQSIDLLNSVMTGGVGPNAGQSTSYQPGVMDYLSTIAQLYGAYSMGA